MANGWGGARPGAGRKAQRSALALARTRLRVLERGIAGDLDGTMPEDVRAQLAEDRMVEYLHRMQQGKWPELVPMYFAILGDAALRSSGADEGASGPGVSRLLAALQHAPDVRDRSQCQGAATLDAAMARPGEWRAPESGSGAEAGEPNLGGLLAVQLPLDLWRDGLEPGAGRAGGAGGPHPPRAGHPPLYAVSPQNFEFPAAVDADAY